MPTRSLDADGPGQGRVHERCHDHDEHGGDHDGLNADALVGEFGRQRLGERHDTIVNISSAMALRQTAGSAAYSGTKAYVR